MEGKKYIPKNLSSQTFAHPKLGADRWSAWGVLGGEGRWNPCHLHPRVRKLLLKSYLMRSDFLVRQLMHCLPAGSLMAVFKICRVVLHPQPPPFRQELPATWAVRADVRVHPADAQWRKQWLMQGGGQLLLWDPFVCAPDKPNLTQPGPLAPRRS